MPKKWKNLIFDHFRYFNDFFTVKKNKQKVEERIFLVTFVEDTLSNTKKKIKKKKK